MNRLRRDDDDEPGRHLRHVPEPSLVARSSPRGSTAPPVILIADDTSDTRELYAMYFAGRGFKVFTAADGESAVQIALDSGPDGGLP